MRDGGGVPDGIARSQIVFDSVEVNDRATGDHQSELLAVVPERRCSGVVPGLGLNPDDLQGAGEVRGQEFVAPTVVLTEPMTVQSPPLDICARS